MLHEHERTGSLDEPTASMAVNPTASCPATNDPDSTTDHHNDHLETVIAGRYHLLELIGEGGMGSVWLAQQTEPVKRLVAVKLIKSGMDTRAVLARFEAERQALAVMDHPSIARILDGGMTETGTPYFVMEYVRGVKITEYCDSRKLTPSQRLELFLPVCQAIQHAHHKGIIHRDIKPSNVLIALVDDKPVPKVIDFGIAKAAGGSLTDSSYRTEFGCIIGTPEYMSPEQANLNSVDIDTRSDVYSLGVLLYELLAGSPPFRNANLKLAGLLEMLRVVREEDPPRPGTKLSTSDELAGISLRRGMEPKKLLNLLRNELDWIVMKALEKDRARRYDSANALALDLQRYLSGETVQAHPPSTGYRLRKFVRRNKGRVIAACLVIVALFAGLAGTSWQAVRAGRAEERTAEERDRAIQSEKDARSLQSKAEQEEQKARKSAAEAIVMTKFFKELTLESRRSVQDGGKWRAKTVDEAVAIIDTEPIRTMFADHPLAEADIREWLGSSASSRGGGFTVTFSTIPTFPGLPSPKGALTTEYTNGRITMPHDAEAVRKHFERAFELRRVHLGPDDPKTLATMYRLGQLNLSQGRFAQVFVLLGELVTRSSAALGSDHDDTLIYRAELAMTYEATGKLDEAFRMLKEIYKDTEAKWGAVNEKTLNGLDRLARICEKTGDLEEALRLREKSLLGRRKLSSGSPDPFVGYALQNVARLHDEMQHYAQTEPLWREALQCVKEDERVSVEVQASLGLCLLRTQKPAEAEPVLRECLGAREKTHPNHWPTFHTKSLLGESYIGQKRYVEAEPLLLAGYDGMKLRENQMHPVEKIHLVEALSRLVQLYDAWGKKELSEEWRKKLESAKVKVQPPTKKGINGIPQR